VLNTYEVLDSKTERALDRFRAALRDFKKEEAQQLRDFKKEAAQQLREFKREAAQQLSEFQQEEAQRLDRQEKALSKLQLEIEKSKTASETLAKRRRRCSSAGYRYSSLW
jgi:DNA-binding protein H-NS